MAKQVLAMLLMILKTVKTVNSHFQFFMGSSSLSFWLLARQPMSNGNSSRKSPGTFRSIFCVALLLFALFRERSNLLCKTCNA